MPEAVRLANRLRDLRESHGAGLSQQSLAYALSDDVQVTATTINSWESSIDAELPTAGRLRSYALFFCTDRTIDGTPRLIPARELMPAEQERFEELYEELIEAREAVRAGAGSPGSGSDRTWVFESGPITIICPEAPLEVRSQLSDEREHNYTQMYRYGDLDALIELWGHVRASNPELEVSHRLPEEVTADDLSSHLVMLGGIAWNHATRRLLKYLHELPIAQVEVPDLDDGEIFRAKDTGTEFWAQYEQIDDVRGELVEDVALLARVRNPYNHDRTITICNGIHSRGVLGAVRTLTARSVRKRNEAYLSKLFPDGSFALLLRVPVMNGQAIAPDLEIPENRLFQWAPHGNSNIE
ncbi:helix-turn-helix domain-containing protein [Streptomyces sp. SID13031]|uniref:helix-turn-helix domain-containing protein n=1 Tax=Streptomyces sp. SID13031 TaxID=2706046 RepID=UPI0013CAD88A|nr:helix-turn-helix domain-containing protein [Streptomyces sp. SID13031]NEA35513.1 helix-turn-helix transcriptional regulator [Streptomyces sp. SID13031]